MNNTIIYSALPVDPENIVPNLPAQSAIIIQENVLMRPVEYINQSDLWENVRIKKALRIFPTVGFMSAAALTISYATAYMAYMSGQENILEPALHAAKWSQTCLLGNLAIAGGTRILSKISGKWKSETRGVVLHTLAASFPCIFARVVCCEVEPDTRTIAIMQQVPV